MQGRAIQEGAQEVGKGFAALGTKMLEISDLNQKVYALKEHDKEMTQIELDAAQNPNISPKDQVDYLKRAQTAREKAVSFISDPKSKAMADLDFSQKENNLHVKLTGEMYKQTAYRGRAEIQDLESQIISKEGVNLDATDLVSARNSLITKYDALGIYNPEQAQERDQKFIQRRTKNRLDAMQAQAVSSGDKAEADAFISSLNGMEIDGKPISADMKADYAKSTLESLSYMQKKIQSDNIRITNENEASYASKIANNQTDDMLHSLESDRLTGQISEGFYQTAKYSLNQTGGVIGGPDVQANNFASLVEKFSKVQYEPENTRTQKMVEFRNEVLANKQKLGEAAYSQLLGLTDPKFIKENVEPKKDWLSSGMEYIKSHFQNAVPHTGTPTDMARVLSDFVSKATAPEIKNSKDTFLIADQLVKNNVVRNNPSLVGKEDGANGITTAEEGFKQLYSGTTKTKPDFTIQKTDIPSGYVVMIAPNGSLQAIPEKNVGRAREKGYRDSKSN